MGRFARRSQPLLIVLGALFAVSSALSQDVRSRRDSTVTIITKVPFEGKDYFITLVPIDSNNIDRMPIVGRQGDRRKPIVWNDSLQRLLPEKVLRELQRRRSTPPNMWR